MIKKNELCNLDEIGVILIDIDHTLTIPGSDELTLKEVLKELSIPYKDEYSNLLCDAIVNTASKDIITLENLDSEFYKLLPFIKDHNLDIIDFRKRIFDSELRHLREVPNIRETIDSLYLDYQIHCFTDWFYDLAVEKVKKIGILGKVKSIISSQDKFSKKDLESFKFILRGLDKKPEEVIMIGDSKNDIHSSKIGIQSILVDYYGEKNGEIVEDATAIVTESKDIAKLLRRGVRKWH